MFEKAVGKPLDDWLASLTELKKGTAEYEEARIKYDHYKDKYLSLQEEKRQSQMKGKVFSKDGEERLARNAEKLAEAEAGWTGVRDGFLARCCAAFDEAGHTLDYILMRQMQFEKQVFLDSSACTKGYEASVATMLASAKQRKAVLAASGAERSTAFAVAVVAARERGGRLDALEMPTNTQRGEGGGYDGAPAPTSFASFAGGASSAGSAPTAAAPHRSTSSGGGWDGGFGSEAAEAEAAPAPALKAKAAGGAGNPFGAPSVATSGAEAAPAGRPPRGPASDSSSHGPAPVTSTGEGRKASPVASAVGGLFGKARGMFGGVGGNPFGKGAEGAGGGERLGDGEEGAGGGSEFITPPVAPSTPAPEPVRRVSAASSRLPVSSPADASAMAASSGGWDDTPLSAPAQAPEPARAPSPAPAAVRAAAPAPLGFDADPWGAPAPVAKAPAPAASMWSEPSAPAAAGGGFEADFGSFGAFGAAPAARPAAKAAPAADFDPFGGM